MNYLKEELLAERMGEFKDTWTLLESYIPSSTIVAKNIDKGGSAFIPQRVNQVITATVMAYREMLNVGGIKSREQSEKEILASVTKELAKLKRAAKKAVAEVEETED